MTHYDYGFRIYNPGIAKFLSRDPLSADYPFYSPYAFAGNIPTKFIDLDGLEPTKAELFWKTRPDLEIKLHGKNQDWVTYYQTQGIHSNDQYFSNAHKMIVAHTYSSSGSDNYAYWDEGVKGWVPFSVSDIGINKEQATAAFAYSVGGTGVIVTGMHFGLGGQLFNQGWKQMAIKGGTDALNQWIIKGSQSIDPNGTFSEKVVQFMGGFNKIDWANSAASAFINDKFVKNTISSALDLSIANGFGDKDAEDMAFELLLRTGVDKLFTGTEDYLKANMPKGQSYPKSDFFKGNVDLIKKMLRDSISKIYKEKKKESTN